MVHAADDSQKGQNTARGGHCLTYILAYKGNRVQKLDGGLVAGPVQQEEVIVRVVGLVEVLEVAAHPRPRGIKDVPAAFRHVAMTAIARRASGREFPCWAQWVNSPVQHP